MKDQHLVREMFMLARKCPSVDGRENALIKEAAVRLSQLTGAWAYDWRETVRRAFSGLPAFLTGYSEGGITYDCWVLLYSPSGNPEDPVYALASKDLFWTIEPDNADAILWSDIPDPELIRKEQDKRKEERKHAKQGTP